MLGLRTLDGCDLESLRAATGLDPRAGREGAIARQVALGNLVDEGARLRIPAARWLHADGITVSLL